MKQKVIISKFQKNFKEIIDCPFITKFIGYSLLNLSYKEYILMTVAISNLFN